MSLALAHIVCGALLLVLGGFLLLLRPGWAAATTAALRSTPVAIAFLIPATVWFAYNLSQLGPSDFGDFRFYFIALFGLTAFLSFWHLRDFLAVRAVAGCWLVLAGPLLDSAYMLYDVPQRLWMVGAVYVGIVIAIWWGVSPYQARDFLNWMWAARWRSLALGGLLAGYGAFLFGVLPTLPPA